MLSFLCLAATAAFAVVSTGMAFLTDLTPTTPGQAAQKHGPRRLQVRGDRPLEHVVLANCKSSSSAQSPQMAYYNGAPSGVPNRDDVTSDVQRGGRQGWTGGQVTGRFPTGVAFTATITTTSGEGQYAGIGYNGYPEEFYCYQKTLKGLYKLDGLTCDGVYSCNHTAPPGKLST